MSLIETVEAFVKTQPLIAGGAGVALMGWAMSQAKTLPMAIWRTFSRQFSTTLTILNEDDLFIPISRWLAQHPDARHSRTLSVTSYASSDSDEREHAITPGPGLHLLREGWRFFIVKRDVEQATGTGSGGGPAAPSSIGVRRQTITITTLGRSQDPIKKLIDTTNLIQSGRDRFVAVRIWEPFYYQLVDHRPKRAMDTVYLPPALKQEIIDDILAFNAPERKAWYRERGVPYRRGYLLEGPPGTGKSTLILAIASLLELPIYVINVGALRNDLELMKGINAVSRGIVVLEDIDCVKASKDRELTPEHDVNGDVMTRGVTLTGLLNALDGVAAKEGRLLFLSSNHPDTLDPALIRPGRVDKRFHLPNAGLDEATEMFSRFYPEQDPTTFLEEIKPLLPASPATLQSRLLALYEAA